MKKRVIIVIVSILLVIGLSLLLLRKNASAPGGPPQSTANNTNTANPETQPQPVVPVAFNKQAYSLDDPTSIWVIVNKKRPLPNGYVPGDLVSGLMRKEAYTQLQSLQAGAQNASYSLSVLSAYRSQGTQTSTYGAYVAKDGVAQADTYSARPRYSEHQTGLAVDVGNGVCNLEICFGNTPAGQWLENHAHEYGFIIRYPQGKTPVTGYQYEPWHLRYVGKDLANEIFKTKQTLEEFFGLPPAPSY
jgi:D-alanyl-D-alanine carboxypeptidase